MTDVKVSGVGENQQWNQVAWKRTGRALNMREATLVTQTAGRFKWSVGRKLSSPATALQVWLSAVFKLRDLQLAARGKAGKIHQASPASDGRITRN
jgi:hypothetical protein